MASKTLPTTASDLTEEWLNEVLIKNIPEAKSVKLVSIRTQKEFESGTLSSISNVCCKITKLDGVEETLKLFIKIMPKDEQFRAVANSSQMDKTEIESYKILLPELEKFEKEATGENPERISPKLYAGDYDLNDETRSWYIILEDLGDTHFMQDFGKGLTLDQLTLALEKLAHFHALTYSYGKVKGINFREKYKFFSKIFDDFSTETEFNKFIEENLVFVQKDLQDDPSLEYLLPKLKGLREKVGKMCDSGDNKVIVHADIWGNNYMFSKDENERSCFMVDWQFTSAGNPMWDLGPVAFLSMDPDATSANLDTILKAYYNKFNASCTKLGLKDADLLWPSFENFEHQALENSLFTTFVWSVISYQVVNMYPAMRQRYLWVLKTSHQLHPELYCQDN